MAHLSELDLSGPVAIVSHGGCPDGALSALTLRRAVLATRPEARVQVSEVYHSKENAQSVNVDTDTTLFFVDISPTDADLPKLKVAKKVVVLDHHKSAAETVAALVCQVPGMVDCSDTMGSECGASLVQRYVGSAYRVPPCVLELAWKLDVYEHELPSEHARFFEGFRGWVNMKGERKTSVKLMEELVDDFDACIARGKELFDRISAHTQRLFDTYCIVHEQGGFRIALVDVSLEDQATPVDYVRYQALIDTLSEDSRPTLFATANREMLANNSWNLGLRRAGVGVDVGKVAAALVEFEWFAAGGGHPFAAGAQCQHLHLSRQILIAAMVQAAEHVLCSSEASAAHHEISNARPKPRANVRAKAKGKVTVNAKVKAQAKARARIGARAKLQRSKTQTK